MTDSGMNNQECEEAALLAALDQGGDDALGVLFARYRDRLKRIAKFRMDYRIAGRVSESDIVQDTFLAASTRLEHYRQKPDMPFFIWLRMLVQQQLADLHRKHVRAEKRDVRQELNVAKDAQGQTSLAIAAHLVGQQTSPSQALSRVEKINAVQRALQKMDEIDCEIIALRHFEELKNSETAEVLGISKRAASKRYVRALQRMKHILNEVPGFDD